MPYFKKVFLLFALFFFSIQSFYNTAKADAGVLNLRNFYGSYSFEDHKSIDTLNNPLTNELTFNMGNYQLNSEMQNDFDVAKFKGKKVDIFGISYKGVCGTNYMYGGVTKSDNNLKQKRNIPINLSVNGENKTVVTERISTDKKMVTVQEIDVKLRKYLQDEYNIYGHNKTNKGKQYGTKSKFYSGFDTGTIVFHMNDGNNFSYDLFDYGHGQPEDFLKIYKDNKTIDSEVFHLDVEISFLGKE
ncbi:TPA: staphylococcal enterotoxin type 32 [Staphylococcus aureus]